jgi:hypothetical protein
VAHVFNLSHLGGWDWEDWVSRPAWANSSRDPISKITGAKWPGTVKHLLCKHQPLSWNPSPTWKKKKGKIYFGLQFIDFSPCSVALGLSQDRLSWHQYHSTGGCSPHGGQEAERFLFFHDFSIVLSLCIPGMNHFSFLYWGGLLGFELRDYTPWTTPPALFLCWVFSR